ncbi:hypothetical protein [Kitasatospora sp. NPDC059673]|uniref:hypothetical protein n=1 Tax=Kitasatospora sp. NPDC059673 TaxID=3346901 RepID=UPI003686E39F
MASTTPRTDRRPEPAEAARVRAGRPRTEASHTEAPQAPVPMWALLASCRAAEAVSTPPERHAA